MIGEISISFQKQNDMKEIEESPIWENLWFERSILRHASLMTLSFWNIWEYLLSLFILWLANEMSYPLKEIMSNAAYMKGKTDDLDQMVF